MDAKQTAKEYRRIAREFSKAHGWACYDLGGELIRLGNQYHRLTGKRLPRPTHK